MRRLKLQMEGSIDGMVGTRTQKDRGHFFGGLADTLRLKLVTNRAFSCGTVLLSYEPFRD